MNNVTITLYRSELNYLIKYDTIRISSDRIINFSFIKFNQLPEQQKVSFLQNSLPLYEQDHEVLLVEYNLTLISYDNAPTLEFKGISSIIPLTETGAGLLSSKLNTDFNILDPLDAKLYRAFANNRSNILRFKSGQKLCSLYNIPIPVNDFIHDFKQATLLQLNNTCLTGNDSTLAHLIDFNVTPSFIPEGKIEALIKSACVGMKKLNKKVEFITKSAFYSLVIKEQERLNNLSIYQAINYIEAKSDVDEASKKGFDKLTNTLSENAKYKNAFRLFSSFYYLKKEIEKSDFDLSTPKEDILEIIHFDIETASKVLFMLGYTFSIQTISKSLQSFSNNELLKTKKSIYLDWTPNIIKEINDPINSEEDNQELIEKIIDPISKQKYKREEIENEKPVEVELSVGSEKEIQAIEPKINNSADTNNGDLFSNNPEVNSHSVVSTSSKIDFKNYKEKLVPIRGSNKLIKALEVKLKDGNIVSKDIVIDCLIEIEKYKTKKDVHTSFAKDVLAVLYKE
ncbi:MAG: hypothetical protein V7670_03095 [Maribacter arcticus]|uniref:hypothetical protein n=1 Tax=Maribacter arcticus TaxID=561365 RepID=UPI0030038AA5